MLKMFVTLRDGEVREVGGKPGLTVKDVILDAGIDEVHGITNCGGSCSCGTCHVIFDPETSRKLEPPHECELDLLEIVVDRQPESRLACQVLFTDALDGAKVRIGAEP
ncbi:MULTISPECIES: 2Fe-2S iron-sulfur cluster-binding protein [unclassified Novosphingobium]|uniref:2Fe-2S iron-sulfur cluster-binding protein n=1 Tax=unclassified Novosphingobium TaxID=2644732 RepID=UPI000D2F7A4C|nr:MULTISPECIES: 2Fe-2S iron-sulfur cluster-binding protein [unclassified Novosphingobium]PTR12584.1 2Fe-2S ferredoxin [Novosphingobium sp. GV055]PUB06368.1 2Fe-2S ferredoxin [Novosphingobium sp. GV061]PUB22419.1 2Fe-2S ferredoxin [Novosphingobium sp. GV079]PUB44444.1 2Fe-2S ferredoxin [Novosphingobium sp. GV027]